MGVCIFDKLLDEVFDGVFVLDGVRDLVGVALLVPVLLVVPDEVLERVLDSVAVCEGVGLGVTLDVGVSD